MNRLGFLFFVGAAQCFIVVVAAQTCAQSPRSGDKADPAAASTPKLRWPPIPHRVPPAGIDVDSVRLRQLAQRLNQLRRSASAFADRAHWADVGCLLKAVDLAIAHQEFYDPDHLQRADTLLTLAASRLEHLKDERHPWTSEAGRIVRGFRSQVDGSPQPYGLEIPTTLDLGRPSPLYVWLHGRGDKTTDLHFIHERLQQAGQIQPNDAIVLHPFGRQCIGYKSAGETDVFEAIAHVRQEYSIDPQRIVLMGFSMGGAGAWHLAAHYADRWVAASPGAGFAETAEYNRLTPDHYPPDYEQALWGVYDVPAYTRNLFNLPVVAYSGENDKQIQAAQVMERSFAAYGKTLTHLIGPGMGHKYHPETLAEILTRMRSAVNLGRDDQPNHVELQTRTLRYSSMFWVQALRLAQHWQDSQIIADYEPTTAHVKLTTKNMVSLQLNLKRPLRQVTVDDQSLAIVNRGAEQSVRLVRERRQPDGRWTIADRESTAVDFESLAKRPGLQGPMDDVFREPFLVVLPSGTMRHPDPQAWMEFEIDHLHRRWRSLFRGDLRVKLDTEVSDDDFRHYHLVLWGDAQANRLVGKLADHLPVAWTQDALHVDGRAFDPRHHVPALVFPNPLNAERYVLLNSGPTFREAHDRTNSLQNPKLADWAVIDIRQPPNAESPGKIVASEFFDEQWRFQ